MQVKGIPASAIGDSVSTAVLPVLPAGNSQLRDPGTGLTYGEIAYAINLSGMPTVRPTGRVEDPMVYIAASLALYGREVLREQTEEAYRLAMLKYFGADKATRRAASLAQSRMWGGPDRDRRFNRAHSLAERHWRTTTIYRDLAVA